VAERGWGKGSLTYLKSNQKVKEGLRCPLVKARQKNCSLATVNYIGAIAFRSKHIKFAWVLCRARLIFSKPIKGL